jgi:hypothetical protein
MGRLCRTRLVRNDAKREMIARMTRRQLLASTSAASLCFAQRATPSADLTITGLELFRVP